MPQSKTILLTDADLDAMAAREAAATPLPWAVSDDHGRTCPTVAGSLWIACADFLHDEYQGDDPWTRGDCADGWHRFAVWVADVWGGVEGWEDRATREARQLRDAEFIVHAREDMPKLLAEVRRLRGA